ncbi:MAG: hypothetical protein JNK23_21705 [Opitutaceae bacterium]|nr:hypothetical protein [Opitutaceae bacterium]
MPSRSALLASLPPEPVLAPRAAAAKIIVLDDDPTGTQTVHGIPVLTTWGVEELTAELRAPEPCCYILTNTRAFPVARACAINREIGANLARAAAAAGRAFTVVSRGDSTLRGHYPAETDALAEALGGGFDGTLIIPAFFAGGRVTIGDTHYVADGDRLVPAGETEFARDASFGYRASDLRAWVEEKTAGRIRADEVLSLSLEDLRTRNEAAVAAKLATLPRGGVAIVNAAGRGDLAALTHVLAHAERAGRRYLFRTAADFVAAYAGIAPRPLLTAAELAEAGSRHGGLLVAGSYVGKTSAQLEALFAACPALERVEISVEQLLLDDRRATEIARCATALAVAIAAGRSAALVTSRRLITGRDAAHSLAIGETVSASLVGIVRDLAVRPRWLIAKGGITSSDTATRALGLRRALVLGQALPGVPVWRAGPESKWPGLAYVVFPGNVGGPDALATLVGSLLA